MAQVMTTPRAKADLLDIWFFIADDNVEAADRLLDRIDGVCKQLTDSPALGPARPDLRPDFRYFSVGRYLILYRIAPGGVEIVRVVHGARDLTKLLQEG
jgi:toxin ParE1/3/4